MNVNEIVSRLNEALTGEVEAILVYANTKTICDSDALKLLMLETSFDEMRHTEMLAELIHDIDGLPEFKPRKVRLLYAGSEEEATYNYIEHTEMLEKEAVKMYESMIKDIEDENIQKVLKKILDDEMDHLKKLEDLEEELED